MNPYESPRRLHARSPIRKRLVRGVQLAWHAYWENLRLENVTFFEHLGAWFAIAATGVVVAGLLFVALLLVLGTFGIVVF